MSDKVLSVPYQVASVDNNILPQTISTQFTISSITTEQTTSNTVTNVNTKDGISVKVTGVDETSVPTSDKFKRALDQLNIAETPRLNINKLPSTELIDVSDLFGYIAAFNRIFPETVYSATFQQNYIGKASRDISSISEQNTKHSNLTKISSSKITIENYIAALKLSLDSYSVSEVHRALLNKPIPDTIVSQELLNRVVSFNRSFEDYVDATDDYYGLANLDDDQYAHFDKRLISLAYPDDTNNKQTTKLVNTLFTKTDISRLRIVGNKLETVVYTDLVTLKPRKNNRETVAAKVAVNKLYTKPRADILQGLTSKATYRSNLLKIENLATAIQVSKLIAKKAAENINIADLTLPALFMPRQYLDSSSLVDLSLRSVLKVQQSQISIGIEQYLQIISEHVSNTYITDIFNTTAQYFRNFADFIAVTDDYYGLANIDDDQTALFNKNIISGTYYTDLVKFFNQINYLNSIQTNSNYVSKNIGLLQQSSSYAEDLAKFKVLLTVDAAISTISEAASKYFGSQLSTESSLAEIHSVQAQKYLGTTYNVDDSLAKYYSQVSLDSIPVVDTKLLQLSTVHSNILTVQSQARSSTQKLSQDSTNTIDDSIFSIADLVGIITSTNSIEDSIDILSYIAYAISEIIAITDAGYANNQNYFAEAYVEPGYVGTNSYF